MRKSSLWYNTKNNVYNAYHENEESSIVIDLYIVNLHWCIKGTYCESMLKLVHNGRWQIGTFGIRCVTKETLMIILWFCNDTNLTAVDLSVFNFTIQHVKYLI